MVETQRTVETPQGPITYTLAVKQVKNLNLRVRSDGTVCVSIGRRVPSQAADDFVRERAAWITAHRTRRLVDTIPLIPPAKEEAGPLLAEAVERVYPLVEPLGVKKPAIQVRFMTSRWGSCHWTKGKIVLNTALGAVPRELRDYVALHELVHFLHPNHQKGFYAVMGRLMPDWQARRKALREYRLPERVPVRD